LGPLKVVDGGVRSRLDTVIGACSPEAGRRSRVTVFGDDYDTPDGTCIRDYIHVTDLAQAHVLALQALESGAQSTAYNLGNGHGFSVREVIAHAVAVTGSEVPVVVGPRRCGDPPRLVGDATRAIRELGWRPRLADLTKIMETAWDWHHRARREGLLPDLSA